jgi:predicted O-methyltransferase YrrM
MVNLTVDFGPCTPPADIEALQSLVRGLGAPHVVEIGSWLGRTALAMIEAGAAVVHCVDTWRGTPDPADETFSAAFGRDPLAAFYLNAGAQLGDRIRPWVGDSAFWARHWRAPADLIFIDADHRYAGVAADIAAWTPHVRPGGILCGHDFAPGWPGVVRAVTESGPFERLGQTIWWRRL